MKINYKYTTIALVILLIISVGLQFQTSQREKHLRDMSDQSVMDTDWSPRSNIKTNIKTSGNDVNMIDNGTLEVR